ncbi:MAG: carboxypeptidase regulatory-like domain-containing protein, partial [Bacteroidota bacterium]
MVKLTCLTVITMLLMTVAAAQVKTFTIKGRIADSTGNTSLEGARIDLFSINDSANISHNAVTGKKGNFELKDLHADTFRVLISMTGYPLITKTWAITDSSADLGNVFIVKETATARDSSAAVANANMAKADTTKPGSAATGNGSKINNAGSDSSQVITRSATPDTANFHGLASISGILQDKTDKTPLSGATLTLSPKRDPSIKLDAVSNGRGSFTFRGVPADTFLLSISYIGYEPVDQQVVPSDTTTSLGIILVPKKTKALEGVVIIAKTPPAQQKGDTTNYNASAFKVNPDATTEDLIKKMPGITVDKNGTVTAHGDQVQKVTIDGKDFMGDDATAALRNLPSEVVDKIQVFDRLSDQAAFTGFDDGNSVKAINIVTKSGIKNGQFGRIYAGYGTAGRYNAGGNVSTFEGSRRISVVGTFNNINQQNFSSQDLLGVTSGGGGGNFGGGG